MFLLAIRVWGFIIIYEFLVCTYGKKTWFFFPLSLLEMQWKTSARHADHYVTWNKDNPKRGEKNVVKHYTAFVNLFLHYTLQILTNLGIYIQISESESLLFVIYPLCWNKRSEVILVDIQSAVVTAEKTFSQITIIHRYLNFRFSDLFSSKWPGKGFCQGSDFEPDKW